MQNLPPPPPRLRAGAKRVLITVAGALLVLGVVLIGVGFAILKSAVGCFLIPGGAVLIGVAILMFIYAVVAGRSFSR